MMTKLSVTLVQSHLYWQSPSKNRSHLEAHLSDVYHTDLIVLPELFTTAFCLSAEAEPMDGESIKWMSKIALEKDAVVVGSLIVQEKGSKFNRLIWMRPNGSYEYYDKRHLFSLMSEGEYFAAGKDKLILELNNWKICPLICYDLRFPVYSRNNSNYDLLLYVANWPVSRITHWNKLLFARAIENQSYVIGVNRVGQDANAVDFNGQSMLVDFHGDTVYNAGGIEAVKTITINKQDLVKARKCLPFLSDMDSFTIS